MTKIIKVKNYNSNDPEYEVMYYETENAFCVQVKDYEPDCWKNKQYAKAYFGWFKKNKIIV